MHLTLRNRPTVVLLQEVTVIWREITQLGLLRLGELTLPSVLVALSVLPATSDVVDNTRGCRQTDECNGDGVSFPVEGLGVTLQEDEGRDDTSNVAEGNLPGGTDGAAVVTSQVHVEPAYHHGHRGVAAHCDEEESLGRLLVRKFVCGGVKGSTYHVLNANVVVDVEECSETGQGDTDWDQREGEAVTQLIGEPGDNHRQGERADPWWDGAELSLDWRVAKSGENGWREESVSISWNDEAKIHEAAEPDLVILEASRDITTSNLALNSRGALVDAETGGDVGALFLRKPFSVFWKGREEEVESDGDKAGKQSLKDADLY